MLDLKRWQGFAFKNSMTASTNRLQHPVDEAKAKDLGLKTLRTVCRGHRMFFSAELWVDRDFDEVHKFFQDTYECEVIVFNAQDQIAGFRVEPNGPLYEEHTWEQALPDPSKEPLPVSDSFQTNVIKNLVWRLMRLQDHQVSYMARYHEMHMKIHTLQNDYNVAINLNDAFKKIKVETCNVSEGLYDELRKKASVEAENANLKAQCFEATSKLQVMTTKHDELHLHNKKLMKQIDDLTQSYDVRFRAATADFERSVSSLQRDTAEWTDGVMDYVYGKSGKRLRMDAQRELFKVNKKPSNPEPAKGEPAKKPSNPEPAQKPLDPETLDKKLAAVGIRINPRDPEPAREGAAP